MRLIAFSGIVIAMLSLICSCGSDENIVPDQREAITKYLTGKNIEYADMKGTYRYIANIERPERANEHLAVDGDTVVCYFEAYTFDAQPGTLFFTNKHLIMPDKSDPPAWSTDPLKLTVGRGDVIKGLANGLPSCAKGDSLQLFMTTDLAYGDKWMGVIPKSTALLYILNVIDVKQPI